jgi:hypothetical protein
MSCVASRANLLSGILIPEISSTITVYTPSIFEDGLRRVAEAGGHAIVAVRRPTAAMDAAGRASGFFISRR